MSVTIEAVRPPAPPGSGRILGNAYRIAVTNQAGTPLTASADANVSVLLRAPGSIASVQIEHWTGTSWQPLGTTEESAGIWLALATEFGTFALVGSGPLGTLPPPGSAVGSSGSQGSPVPGLLVPIGIALVAVVFLVGALVALGRRSP